MAKLIDLKLKGSTLIEVLIAMVIIVVIFTIAMQVFANVMQTGVSFRSIKVQQQMRELAQEVKIRGGVERENVLIDSISYELLVLPTEDIGLSQLRISATQQSQKLDELNCLFITNGDGKN